MKRVYNFSAGPSVLPLPALERAAAEMTDANGTGQSVMEMSHRSADFKPIIGKTGELFRELMGIPANYRVLFLQGGASLQFAMVPLNLAAGDLPSPAGAAASGGSAADLSGPAAERRKAVYIETGVWAKKAAGEAAKYAEVLVPAGSAGKAYTFIPEAPVPGRDCPPDCAYYHITLNNTIVGTRWPSIPDTGAVPLVADISSCILSEPLEVSRFGILYAGAQKNLGPAGTTVVIIRDDLVGHAPPWVPAMLRYDIHAAEGSLYNTPPCYGIYMIGLVLEWLKALGGVPAIAKINREKADLLYDYLDRSTLFGSPVEKSCRSLMNIPFVCDGIADAAKRAGAETRFVKEAAAAGLVNLAGHRLVGGMRASMYNAMPLEGAEELLRFMKDFEDRAD